MKFTLQELSTVHIALRVWQNPVMKHMTRSQRDRFIQQYRFIPLTSKKIDRLCERLEGVISGRAITKRNRRVRRS